SATTKSSVANDWQGVGLRLTGATERVVLRFNAPRTSIFSLPVFGQNIEEESEVVLLGTKGLKWDAWRRKAPEFSEQRIDMRFWLGDKTNCTALGIDMFRNVDGNWLNPANNKQPLSRREQAEQGTTTPRSPKPTPTTTKTPGRK